MSKPLPRPGLDDDEPAALLALFLAEHERLQVALQTLVGTARSGTERDSGALMDALLRELAVHAAVEDELLCPFVRRQLSADGLVDPADLEPSIVPRFLEVLCLGRRDDDAAAAGRTRALSDALGRHLGQAIALLESPQRGWFRPRFDAAERPADAGDLRPQADRGLA